MNSRQRRKNRRKMIKDAEKDLEKRPDKPLSGIDMVAAFAMGGLATHFINKFFTDFMTNVEENKKERDQGRKPVEKKDIIRKLELDD